MTHRNSEGSRKRNRRTGTVPEYSEGSGLRSVIGEGFTLETINELKPGDVLGRYQLLMPIAKGGMGQVWAARQSGTRGFQKMVAVKTILPSHEDGQHLEAMLFEEASLASLVRHPNVAETLDLGEREDGTLYLVMEWVDGEPLDQILRTARSIGGVPIAIAVHLITQACKGLHAAHVACNSKGEPLGIVHRDISPQNLLVTYSGVVKLIDFGVAKATQQMSPPTATGEVKGKFAYMSPEQVHGEKLDARADVFAMGIVLYRLTTGMHPFKSDNPAATLRNILSSGPARPSDLVPLYPKALEDVVMKALARDRNDRFVSAHEMMLALEQALPREVQINSDKNTEVFLQRLFAKRIAERSDTLKSALLAADGSIAISTVDQAGTKQVHSQSTMRAVSVENGEPRLEVPDREPIIVSLAPRRRKSRVALAAIAACLVGAVGASVLHYSAQRVSAPRTGVDMGTSAAVAATHTGAIAERNAPTAPVDPLPIVTAMSAEPPARVAASAAPLVPSKKRDSRRVENPAALPEVAKPPAVVPINPTSPLDPLDRRK